MSEGSGYVLRLRIYQPQAHYRIPFTYQRRHTYPIPSYSTVIGFLCNVLGYGGMPKEHNELKKIKISIAGKFLSKTTEYIWFRNLSKEAHTDRFGTIENRSISGHIEHIGGQAPISIDVLDEVRLIIHLAHKEKGFLEDIRSSLENPIRRLDVLHLGRAEDWIVIEELAEIKELSNFKIKRVDANFGYFFWIPEKIHQPNSQNNIKFEQFEGLLYRLPTFWTVEDFDNTLNRHGRRIFDYISAKMSDGMFSRTVFLFDEDCKIPVFLADFEGDLE